MKKIVFNYLMVAVLAILTSCSGTSMKGTTYVNDNAKNEPMVFGTETVGVLKFVDDNKVDILFPYAIDTRNNESSIRISSELWIGGEYERTKNTITISFKLNENQIQPGTLEVQVKDDGKTLCNSQGVCFKKIEK